MKRFLLILLGAVAVGFALSSTAAEPATVIRGSELKREPATDAETVAWVRQNERVEPLERRGGWTRVRTTAGTTGWMKILALRYGESRWGSSGISELFRSARTGSSGTVVTTGVRGLDEEDIAKAVPNPGEVARLDRYAASAADAQRFAAAAPVKAQPIPYPAAGK